MEPIKALPPDWRTYRGSGRVLSQNRLGKASKVSALAAALIYLQVHVWVARPRRRSSSTRWAAASRATGTRKGEQET